MERINICPPPSAMPKATRTMTEAQQAALAKMKEEIEKMKAVQRRLEDTIASAKGEAAADNRLVAIGKVEVKAAPATAMPKLSISLISNNVQPISLLSDDDGDDSNTKASDPPPAKKRRKAVPGPKTFYNRVEKKMKAVTQKKYQSKYGAKSHAAHVYRLMKDLIEEHCIDGKIVESDPLKALEMSKASFQAFYDHWQVMRSPGYDTDIFREAMDLFADVLKAAADKMSPDQIEEVVSLLESIEACVSGYCIAERSKYDPAVCYSTGHGKNDTWAKKRWRCTVERRAGENVFRETILTILPDYDSRSREPKKGKVLDWEIRAIKWMNGWD